MTLKYIVVNLSYKHIPQLTPCFFGQAAACLSGSEETNRPTAPETPGKPGSKYHRKGIEKNTGTNILGTFKLNLSSFHFSLWYVCVCVSVLTPLEHSDKM